MTGQDLSAVIGPSLPPLGGLLCVGSGVPGSEGEILVWGVKANTELICFYSRNKSPAVTITVSAGTPRPPPQVADGPSLHWT